MKNKGWYGDRQRHACASKGIRTKQNITTPICSKFRVGVVDENGRDYFELFDNEIDAYERWIEYRGQGSETWYDKWDENEGNFETVQVYDPEEDEDYDVTSHKQCNECGYQFYTDEKVCNTGDGYFCPICDSKKISTADDDFSSHGQTQTIGTHATSTKRRGNYVTVTYHDTDVVKWNPDKNDVILDNGGWFTKTTKDRMNQASNQYGLGYSVFQKDNRWYVKFDSGKVLPYQNGMKFKALGIAKDYKKASKNFEDSASETARNVNKTSMRLEKSASDTAKTINKGINKGRKLFDESANKTAKFLKKIGKKIDDDAEDTAKDVNKIFTVKEKKKVK